MAVHRNHRHNHTNNIGLSILNLFLDVGAAVLKKKLVDNLTPKPTEPKKIEEKALPRWIPRRSRSTGRT